MNSNKFNEAKERLVITAQRVAGNYLLSKYGSAHLTGEQTIELTHAQDEVTSAFKFNGKITCYANDGLLNQVGVNMTINENDIEVTSEDIQGNITNALNAAENQPTSTPTVKASLDGFKLTDDGTIYLKVAHADLHEAKLGVIGKNEYATCKDRASLLQSIVKDAFIETPVEFTGEFKEPAITKQAEKMCGDCQKGKCDSCNSGMCGCDGLHHKQASKKEAALEVEAKLTSKASWLTAELFKDAEEIDYTPSLEEHKDIIAEKTISIQENMPRSKSADHLIQSAQAEEQSALEAQLKVEHEAANELMSMLQGMGYGSAKTVEITSSKEGIDVMTAIDHQGAIKAVSIPVTIRAGKVVLPKKSIIATLIEKGLNVQAKLAEQFDLELLEKLAAIDERMAYEANEVSSILNDKTVEKTAAGEKQPFFDSDDSTMTVQKHMLPNHENLKVGDRLSDGTDQYEIVNQDGQQNSKGEGDSSLWTLKKCQDPERDDKKVKNKIPS